MFKVAAFVTIVLFAAPAAFAQGGGDDDFLTDGQPQRTRKTLFRWNFDEEEEEEDEGPDRIVTDRPHFSEASSLVGLGRVQLETGYTVFRNGEGKADS